MTDQAIFEELREKLINQGRTQDDIIEIKRAFDFAAKLHHGQYRLSEEPYIIHPVEVAKILAGLRVDVHTIITTGPAREEIAEIRNGKEYSDSIESTMEIRDFYKN